MKLRNLFPRSAAAIVLALLFAPEASAQNFSTLWSKSKDYGYDRYYGNSTAGGSIHLDADTGGRILFCQPHVLVEAKGNILARKRVRVLGKSLEVARLHVEAIGQSRSFDQSGSTISNIGDKGRFVVDRFIRLGGVTVWHPSPYKKEFTSASQVWPTSISKTYSTNFLDFNKMILVWGVPITFGVRVGGGVTLSLGADLDPSNTNQFVLQLYGEARGYGFATGYGYVGGPGFGAGPELECQFMQIRVRPYYNFHHSMSATPKVRVTRTTVDLYGKLCAKFGWFHPCVTMFNYSKGSNSWLASLK